MRQRQRGFTIVEALVVAALMSIALSSITMASIMSTRADTKSHRQSVATALAQAKLDQMRTLPHGNAAWSSGAHSEAHLGESGASQLNGLYTRQWTVVLNYNNLRGLSRVTATVSWNEGQERSVTLSSLYW
jgi:prepilin-type N-terminal cleavage/methylation domain-containing protein